MKQPADKLADWLETHNARIAWHADVRNVGKLDAYFVGDGIAIVLRYDDRGAGGWDLFVPAALSPDIGDTLEGAEFRLNLPLKARQRRGRPPEAGPGGGL